MSQKNLRSGAVQSSDGTAIHYDFSLPESLPLASYPFTLVFCNGAGMDSSLWKHFLDYFRHQYPILTWDYRGHGQSEKLPATDNDDAISIVDHCEDLEKIFKELNISRSVLLGHSMGVKVIIEFYRKFPDLVLALVPICGSFQNPLETFLYTPVLQWIFPWASQWIQKSDPIISPIWRLLSRTRLVEEISLTLATNRSMAKREDFRPYIDNLNHLDLQVFFRTLKGASEYDAGNFLKKILVPTLIIAGQWDHITPVKISKIMHQEIPDSDLMIIPQGSHCALMDQPEWIHLKTEAFLKQLLPSNCNQQAG